MRRFGPILVGGVMAATFSTFAFADRTGDNVHIRQQGTQNSAQTGDGSQSSQVIGERNQTTQQGADSQSSTVSGNRNTTSNTEQTGAQNQSAIGSGNQQSQQSGSGHSASQRSSAGDDNLHNRQSDNPGKHKGWARNKHRDKMD